MNPTPALIPVAPSQLRWLNVEAARWEAAGLVDGPQRAAILGLYAVDTRTDRRFSLAKLLLSIGGTFIGIGVIWLIAANIDSLPPTTRFLAIVVLWLAALIGAEWLAGRRAHGGSIPSPVVGAARLLAVLLFGGVIFQAAQSLQVPAYEPKLIGLWALGSLVHAYAVRATMPLLVGLCLGAGWVVWQVLLTSPSALAAVLALQAAAVGAAAMATLHRRSLPAFVASWREVGAVVGLGTLFAAAVPELTSRDFTATRSLVLILSAAALLTIVALIRERAQWQEPAAAVAMLLVSLLLVLWDAGRNPDSVGAADWAHAAVSVAAYVAAALWVAVLAIRHESPRLTTLATGALVVFTTFQSFAVFAQIITGAWLFLMLGLILAGTGYGFDRARRELAEALA